MRTLFSTIALLGALLAFGQSFEGTLVYSADLEPAESMKKMGLTKETLIEKMKAEGTWGDRITHTYKQGNYRMHLNSTPASVGIYTAATNKMYTVLEGEDACVVTDYAVDLEATMTGKPPTVTKLDTVVTIDGAACNIVRVKWKSGTYEYTYDPTRLKVDASLYAQHVYDGWGEYLKIAGALPVRIVKKVKGVMTATITLISAKEEPIADALFALPNMVPDPELNVARPANQEVMRIKK